MGFQGGEVDGECVALLGSENSERVEQPHPRPGRVLRALAEPGQ